MSLSYSDIYSMLATLTLEAKEQLLEDLRVMIEAEKSAPKKSYLEEHWSEIERLLQNLRYEPYIDDQWEIEEIWNICEEMIKSGKLKKEPWKIRRNVLKSIIGGEYYDYYSVYDPMEDLFNALMFTSEEKLECADIISKIGSDYMKRDGAKLYKECGQLEKYVDYVEQHLKDKAEPYVELIEYYRGKDTAKAVEIAELGLKKCKDDQTDIIIFLIENAREKGDEVREVRFKKGAKARRAVNYAKVQEVIGE